MSSSPSARRTVIRRAALATTVVPVAFAMFAAGPASATENTVERTYTIKAAPMPNNLTPMNCPSNAPFLKNQNLSPGRIVPNGVEVIENGGVGVTLRAQGAGWGPYAIGYAWGTATNWKPGGPQDVVIKLWCTDDRSQATPY